MTHRRQRILIVGAGFAGATVARELADHGGYHVTVIDQRPHLAGNCFDTVDPQTGVRFHKYGPHIFHTNDQSIVAWLSRFTSWLPYQHRVRAFVAGVGHVPLPINRTTIAKVSGVALPDAAATERYLDDTVIPNDSPENARAMAESKFGAELTELFFARYTKKMWNLELEDLPASVLARLPVRTDTSDGYFTDTFQAMPRDGYTALFQRLLDHPAITLALATAFHKSHQTEFDHAFLSMPIDRYFDEQFGPLPYRSIRFTHRRPQTHDQPTPTVNYTDTGPITRCTDWRLYPGHARPESQPLLTDETPCDYRENNFERYYPIKTVDGTPQRLFKDYEAEAARLQHVTFIGRCGQYRYLDMHQVIANSKLKAQQFIAQGSCARQPKR
jgi:UDP-galactopyranose mutase